MRRITSLAAMVVLMSPDETASAESQPWLAQGIHQQ
jgi:hypothetical protein